MQELRRAVHRNIAQLLLQIKGGCKLYEESKTVTNVER